MNIKVQRQKPNKREGSQGEMRLVISGRGTYLYINDGNQWFTLNMYPSESADTMARRERGDFQRKVLQILDPEGNGSFTVSGDDYLNGSILSPGGDISAPDEEPR